jgi:hypothetical protein
VLSDEDDNYQVIKE